MNKTFEAERKKQLKRFTDSVRRTNADIDDFLKRRAWKLKYVWPKPPPIIKHGL